MNILEENCINKNVLNAKNVIYYTTAKNLIEILNQKDNLIFENLTGDIQRNLDINHLTNLIEYQEDYYKKYGYFSYPNPLMICSLNNKLSLLDGQHRYESLKFLCKKYNLDCNIMVGVLEMDTMEQYDEYFYAVNQNKPVSLYNNIEDWKNVIKKLEKYMNDKWLIYIKNTGNPRVPHINIERMKKYMDDHNIVRKTGITYEEFVDHMVELNVFYSLHWKKYIKPHLKNAEVYIKRIEDKLCSSKCYLGLYKNFEWIDRIVYKYKEGVSYENMDHVLSNKRVKIPRKIRKKLWKTYFKKSIEGECYVCKEEIDFDNFECGHIKSVFFGGNNKLDNLRPLCRICNNDMGINDMNEYMKKFDEIGA